MVDLTQWLRRHAGEPLSIEQIARHMNTTPTTLQRHFRQALGMTVFDFLQQERLRLAPGTCAPCSSTGVGTWACCAARRKSI